MRNLVAWSQKRVPNLRRQVQQLRRSCNQSLLAVLSVDVIVCTSHHTLSTQELIQNRRMHIFVLREVINPLALLSTSDKTHVS